MDGEFVDDLNDVLSNVSGAEVISMFFPTFRRALVIDTRSNDTDGPMLRVMPMAASPQERMRSIRRLRPGFPRLQNLTLIPWSRYVDSLVRLGVWEQLVQRLDAGGLKDAGLVCDSVLGELQRLEKAEMAAVVRGENYHTIWTSRR